MMHIFLCCAKSLPSQIDELHTAGKKGSVAARKCLAILAAIRSEGLANPFLASKRTRKGEARIEKCVKYDLSHGYRLITIRCGDHLFIPFVGAHDKANVWLEHNRLEDIYSKKHLYTVERIVSAPEQGGSVQEIPPETEERDEYEEALRSKLDDTTLRHVFKGLVEQG